ncbi:MAG: tetratricopeptide repeat protein, partial [Vicinamibacteria bacterium]
ADTVHLKGGGKIEAASWKIEGNKVTIETRAGTISVDRSEIISIEKKTPREQSPALAPRRPGASVPPAGEPSRAAPSIVPGAASADGEVPGSPAKKPAHPGEPPSSPGASPDIHGLSQSSTHGRRMDWIAIGRDALERGEYERALSSYLAALASDPEATVASLGASRAALALNDAADAAAHARRAVSIDPSSVDGWTLLGAAEYKRGNLTAAKEALEASQRLSPGTDTQAWIDRIAREQAAEAGLSSIHSARFRLEFDAANAPRLARESLAHLDAAYEEMTRLFQHRPVRSLDVILYPRQAFHELTGLGDEVLGLFDGKVRVPTGGLDQLGAGDRKVLKHELAHAFIHSKTRGNCPRWLHEGLA